MLILLVNDIFCSCYILLLLRSWCSFYFTDWGWKAFVLFCRHKFVFDCGFMLSCRLVLKITFKVSRTYIDVLWRAILFHFSFSSSRNNLLIRVLLGFLGLAGGRRPFFSKNLSLSLACKTAYLNVSSSLHDVFWYDGIFLLIGWGTG